MPNTRDELTPHEYLEAYKEHIAPIVDAYFKEYNRALKLIESGEGTGNEDELSALDIIATAEVRFKTRIAVEKIAFSNTHFLK